MTQNQPIPLYQWILQEFTLQGRAEFVSFLSPYLSPLLQPGYQVLDICCGAGPFSFWLEEQGAQVTAVDFAPYMIELALKEAQKRGSKVNFVLADVLAHDLEADQYDLTVFLGNTISDFSLDKLLFLSRKVAKALKQGGKFIIHYIDGIYPFIQESYLKEGVQQEAPDRIIRRFKEYLPEKGGYVEIYTNEASGEKYEYTSYVYTPPVVRLAMQGIFGLENSVRLSEKSFLDVFMAWIQQGAEFALSLPAK